MSSDETKNEHVSLPNRLLIKQYFTMVLWLVVSGSNFKNVVSKFQPNFL